LYVYTVDHSFILNKCFYFTFFFRVDCTSCHHTFSYTRKSFLDQLPLEIRQQFPFFLSYKTGIDKPLLDLLLASCDNGLNLAGVRSLVQESYTKDYAERHAQYLATVVSYVHDQLTGRQGVSQYLIQHEAQIAPFSEFKDKKGYNGHVPSRKFTVLCFPCTV